MATSPKSKAPTSKKSVVKSRVSQQGKNTLGKPTFSKKLVALFVLLFVGVGVFVIFYSQAATAPVNGKLMTGFSQNGTDAALQSVPTIPAIDRDRPAFVPAPTQLAWMRALNTPSQMFTLTSGGPTTRVAVTRDGKRVYVVLQNNTKTSEGLTTYTISSFNVLDGSGRKDLLTINKSAFILDIMLSRDENTLAFRTVDNLPGGGQHHGLFTFSVAGANAKANGTSVKELSLPEGNMSYNMIGFTQDNKLMYYFADFRNNGNNYPDPTTHGNYTVNVDGSNKVFLSTSIYNAIAMAPSGDAVLAYSNASPDSRSITIHNLDGSTRLRLNRESENKILLNDVNSAGWSPDGKSFYMNSYIINATTGAITSQVVGTNIIHWLPKQI